MANLNFRGFMDELEQSSVPDTGFVKITWLVDIFVRLFTQVLIVFILVFYLLLLLL